MMQLLCICRFGFRDRTVGAVPGPTIDHAKCNSSTAVATSSAKLSTTGQLAVVRYLDVYVPQIGLICKDESWL